MPRTPGTADELYGRAAAYQAIISGLADDGWRGAAAAGSCGAVTVGRSHPADDPTAASERNLVARECLCGGYQFVAEHDRVGDLGRNGREEPGLASDGGVLGRGARGV